jgi:putative tricarboxylic transport membrane protein
MPMAWRHIVSGAALLVFTAVYAWLAAGLPDRSIPNTPGPSFFPFVIAALTGVLSLALLVKGMLELPKAGKGLVAFPRTPAAMLVLFVVAVAAMPWLGFVLTGVPFFAALMLLYGCRRTGFIAFWSLAIPLVLYFIFTEIFQILLPAGPLGF